MARNVSDDTKKTIGETIRQLRQEKLWSQADLASRIETTPISIGRWEKSITRPSLHFQQKLCEIFARSPEELGFLPQPKPEHGEDYERNGQYQEVMPDRREQAVMYEQAQSSSHALAPALQHALLRRSIRRPRRSFLLVMVSLCIFLLLSSIFFYTHTTFSATSHTTLSATSRRPSCQVPSSHESTTAIYEQVMCKQAQLSVPLSQQDALQWDENSQCVFTHGAYHVLLPSTAYVTECFAHAAPLSQDFALQVEITILKGYSGGLVFDAEGPSSNWDVVASRLPVDIWGTYNFYLANTNVPCHLSKDTNDLNYCHSPHGTITYGTGESNTITLIGLDSFIYLYANGLFIDQARTPASSPSTGFFGVFANGSQTTADVAFSHLQMWSIPS